jgi:hypothetical protein
MALDKFPTREEKKNIIMKSEKRKMKNDCRKIKN